MHTPSYVPAVGEHAERIYCTGQATRRHYGPHSRYAIGLLQRRGSRWVRRQPPVVTGDTDRPSALEPFVVHTESRYRMWYLASPHEIGPGEQPDYELRCTDSENGITDWTPPTVFADPSDGFFDNTLIRRGDTWWMLLARGSNLHATPHFPDQGLWYMTARSPSADRSDWSTPMRLIDSDAPDTLEWFGRGTYGPRSRIQRSSIADGDRVLHRDPNRPAMAPVDTPPNQTAPAPTGALTVLLGTRRCQRRSAVRGYFVCGQCVVRAGRHHMPNRIAWSTLITPNCDAEGFSICIKQHFDRSLAEPVEAKQFSQSYRP